MSRPGGAGSQRLGPTRRGSRRISAARYLPSLVLSADYTEQRTPPAPRRVCLLKVSGPEQSGSPVCKAHVYDNVLFPTVATHNLADQTPSLLYSVVVLDPYSHTHACVLRLHGSQG